MSGDPIERWARQFPLEAERLDGQWVAVTEDGVLRDADPDGNRLIERNRDRSELYVARYRR